MPPGADQFKDLQRFTLALETQRSQRFENEGFLRQTMGLMADEDLAGTRQVNQMRSGVDGVAHHGIGQAQIRSDVAGDNGARIDGDMHFHRPPQAVKPAQTKLL